MHSVRADVTAQAPSARPLVPNGHYRLAGALADIQRNAVLVDDPPPTRHVPSDPDDDYLIALALAARAHAIVTGDTALLTLELDNPRILTPRDFLTALDSIR